MKIVEEGTKSKEFDYYLSYCVDQQKFYWLIGTILLTVNLFVGALIAIGNMARYTDVATDSAVVNFKDAVFNIKNAFNYGVLCRTWYMSVLRRENSGWRYVFFDSDGGDYL